MALPQLFADSPTPGTKTALTTLSGNGGSISSGATSMLVAGAAPALLQYPGQFDVVIDSEVIRVTAGASGTTWTIARGVDGSTAATHNDGASVYHYLTQGALQNLMAQAAVGLQNGVILSGDLLVGTISINTSTGALTFTPAATGTQPAWVQNSSGLLLPVGYAGGAQTITPSLPASTKYAVIGVEIDTTGAVSLVKGTDTSTQLNTGSLIASNSPATSSGKMRVADFAVWNNAGTYNFSDHTTTAAQGTNWIDRRPWARGAFRQIIPSHADYTITSSSLATIDATNLAARLECTGVPLQLSIEGIFNSNGALSFGFSVDGTTVDGGSFFWGNPTSGFVPFNHQVVWVPTAGSRMILPQVSSGASGTLAATTRQLCFTVREDIRQNASNGTS